MDPRDRQPWGERLAEEGAAATDTPSVRRLIADAVRIVRGRLGEVARGGIRPLLDEAAVQVRPATIGELRARYPGLDDEAIARRLINRASRTAAGVALAIGGALAAQEAVAVVTAAAPPAAGTAVGAVGVTALAEVLVLFVVEAKLRADLGALAGRPALTPRELAANVVGEVQAAGGWSKVRGRSLRRIIPEAAARRTAARIVRLVPARFARIVVPEVVAPIVGAAVSARLAARQVRAAGERHWAELRGWPTTTATWGSPSAGGNGGPPAGWDPAGWTAGRRELPPPEA